MCKRLVRLQTKRAKLSAHYYYSIIISVVILLCSVCVCVCWRRREATQSSLGAGVASLEHEGPHGEPEGVEEREVVLVARVRVRVLAPLHRGKPADDEQRHAHSYVGHRDAHPHLIGGETS